MRIVPVQHIDDPDEQLIEIQKAIVEADNGDFISEIEMAARFGRMCVIVSDEAGDVGNF